MDAVLYSTLVDLEQVWITLSKKTHVHPGLAYSNVGYSQDTNEVSILVQYT